MMQILGASHKTVKISAGNFWSIARVMPVAARFLRRRQPEDFMRKLILAISVLALAGTAASADPIADRKALMKANGKAAGVLAAIVKGEQPFDAAAVLAALTTLKEDADKLDAQAAALFPAGSDKGDTTASPKIWQDWAGFEAKIDGFKTDADAAVAAPPADADGVKVALGKIGQNCQSCHETFRIKKD
jgi:cytochrome c556